MEKAILELKQYAQQSHTFMREIEAALDSGAALCVTPRSLNPEYPITLSENSKRGTQYEAASGQTIPDYGQQQIFCGSEKGVIRRLGLNATDVHKPVFALSNVVNQDHTVIFIQTLRAFRRPR